MYVPHFNALADEAEARALVAHVGSAQLVTVTGSGYPAATLLPVIWDEDRLVFHMARANEHWRSIRPDTPALAVVTGAEAYISPAWYATKRQHGRVVPTWNYSAVQFTGRATVHEDSAWLLDAVSRLTHLHEAARAEPWSVDDAPARYVGKQLHAIVGVEMSLESVEAKAKLSQNRSLEDRRGVVDGLRREGGARERVVADQMAVHLDDPGQVDPTAPGEVGDESP